LASCTSPVSFTGLAEGAHTMHLEATHATGVVTLTDDWIIDQTAPTLTSAVFDGYGTLALTFDEPVDATAAQDLTRYQLTPGLTVTSASAAGAVVSLGLSGYQLPIDYTLTASVRDPAGNQRTGITRTLAAASTGSRVAFLSKATGTGNLSQWTGAGGKTGLVAADSVCQTEAGAAGLTGTFRAYLSDSLNDAACRMRNLNGKVSASCGQAAPPPAGTSAWIGVDGQPVARNLGELTQGELLRSIALEADGTAVSAYRDAWHATDIAAATAGEVDGTTCTDWTSQTGTAFSNAAYQKVIPLRIWSSSACSSSIIGLLCFQVDAGGLPLNNRYRKIGKVAFLTSFATTGAISSGGKTGIAGADNLCQSLAATAGLSSPTSFVAWLSDNTTD
ncbi:MAG: hypothetical protein ACHQ17_15355, partial [Polyangia bacterium]